jgi:hypothetical protein
MKILENGQTGFKANRFGFVRARILVAFVCSGVGIVLWFSATNLWAVSMPQFWGDLPVTVPVGGLMIGCMLYTFLSITFIFLGTFFWHYPGGYFTKCLICAVLLGITTFFVGKFLAVFEARNALVMGNSVNAFLESYEASHGDLPSKQVVEAACRIDWKHVSLSINSTNSWRICVTSQIVFGSEVFFEKRESQRGSWYYIMD